MRIASPSSRTSVITARLRSIVPRLVTSVRESSRAPPIDTSASGRLMNSELASVRVPPVLAMIPRFQIVVPGLPSQTSTLLAIRPSLRMLPPRITRACPVPTRTSIEPVDVFRRVPPSKSTYTPWSHHQSVFEVVISRTPRFSSTGSEACSRLGPSQRFPCIASRTDGDRFETNQFSPSRTIALGDVTVCATEIRAPDILTSPVISPAT